LIKPADSGLHRNAFFPGNPDFRGTSIDRPLPRKPHPRISLIFPF